METVTLEYFPGYGENGPRLVLIQGSKLLQSATIAFGTRKAYVYLMGYASERGLKVELHDSLQQVGIE